MTETRTSLQRHLHLGPTRLAVLVLLTCALPVAAAAASLTNYRARVEAAQKDIEIIISIVAAGETEDEYVQYIQRTVIAIRRSLPENERVEARGGTVEVSNKWLREKLDEFSDSALDTERTAVLTEISEFLSALDAHLAELEAAADAERSRDDDKQKLAEILAREEYQKPPEKQESLFQRWLRQFIEWIDSLIPKGQVTTERSEGYRSLSLVLQIIIYALVIGLLAFLIFRFGPRLARRLRRPDTEGRQTRVILGESIAPTASASDLFAEAEALARSGELRSAIRKGYVALLCDLADRRLIGLARHKTNRDYLRDVRGRPRLFERMSLVTGSFEKHWYGYRPARAEDWEDFRDHYRKAVSEA